MDARPDLPTGTIVLHINGAITTAGVQARIDGRKVPLFLPTTQVPVPAGRHEVEVEGLQGFVTTFGETSTTVTVAPGQTLELHYALPRSIISEGRLGFSPEPRAWSLHWGNIGIGCGGALLILLILGAIGSVWNLLTGT